jgi:uncharacterized protein (DUF983 family)
MAYTEQNRSPFKTNIPRDDPQALARLRRQNNPNNEPTGAFTGRCPHCGSNNLWDDNLAYGCNACGAMLGGN